jgi:hypothetical protein
MIAKIIEIAVGINKQWKMEELGCIWVRLPDV